MTRDSLRSTRSSSRARTTERGIALALAIILSVLYFGLIELMLIDSSRELAEARRFRARIVALTLAENGAELAALQVADEAKTAENATHEDEQGTIRGTMSKVHGEDGGYLFDLAGHAVTSGTERVEANVRIRGYIKNHQMRIEYAMHSQ